MAHTLQLAVHDGVLSQRSINDIVATGRRIVEELTKEISSSSASAADVIPSVMALKCFLGKDVASDHGVKTTKATLLQAVTLRFADIEKEPLYSLATIIDPRYKDRFYSDELKAQTWGLLSDLLAVQTDPDQGPGANDTGEPAEKVPRPGSLSSMFSEIIEEETPQHAHGDSAAPSQMNLYLSRATHLSECTATGVLENQQGLLSCPRHCRKGLPLCTLHKCGE
ncbi:hypothetical protein SKAU_G00060620 [Synaphobranchus kaupii]|uniref:Uncharacterized protein n=1 Tax=Synaphobranchus kaupii TaxID=118154 RepID=A0A9Q1JAQ0_SYNKA|nr:hypothetical protein SKAU_G00060620 [Synaphobranchus kaupii]